MRTITTQLQTGFFIRSEPNASKTGRNFWLGWKEANGDVGEFKISQKWYEKLKRAARATQN